MNYLRRIIFATITLAFIVFAWYGAEMLIHGQSQKSVVDMAIAVLLSLSISGKLEKGAEESERKQAFAEKFADEFIKQIEKGTEAKDDGNRREEA